MVSQARNWVVPNLDIPILLGVLVLPVLLLVEIVLLITKSRRWPGCLVSCAIFCVAFCAIVLDGLKALGSAK